MANHIVSHATRMTQSSSTRIPVSIGPATPSAELSDEQKLKQLEEQTSIDCLTFRSILRNFGLRSALKAYHARYRYIAGLWLLREASIMKALYDNYERVKPGTFSKLVAKPQISSRLSTMFLRLSVRLLNNQNTRILSVSLKTVNKS